MGKRLRIVIGIVLLIISCSLLVWGFWPALQERHVLPINPSQMTLPTPSSFVPDPMFNFSLVITAKID